MPEYTKGTNIRIFSEEDLALYHFWPKDDAWKKCTLRSIVDDGKRLWITCAGCQRVEYVPALEWIEARGIDLDTPLLVLNRRVRCTRCNQRTAKVRAEPYHNLTRNR